LKTLLDAGADINIRSSSGTTALMAALMQGHAPVAETLMARGADVKAKDKSSMTALHLAAQWGHRDLVSALVKAGADVNAEDSRRQTPLTLAQMSQKVEIVEYLKQQGAKEPAPTDLSAYGEYDQAYQAAPTAAALPTVEVSIDPNAIREQVKQFPGLAEALAAVDGNSLTEQRGWQQQRYDNRTTLVGAVQRQFNGEMVFLKQLAMAEKAEKTAKAIDTLVARRKERYDVVGDELRQQRREAMQTPDAGAFSGRTTMSRSRSRTSRSAATLDGTGPYGGTVSGSRRVEPNEPPLDAETANQVQAWTAATMDSKDTLLETVHKLDLAEFDGLRQVAVEEKAKKTEAAIAGVMMLREERLVKISRAWQEEDERLQKIQERYGTQDGAYQPGRGSRGMPNTSQQNDPAGGRRTRRYR